MSMKYLASSVALISLMAWQSAALANPNASCQGESISKTFASGAHWEFCWSIKDQEGLVLSQVHYKAPGSTNRRVLGEAALSQIEADFDDGAVDPKFVTTQLGLGGNNMLAQSAQDCPEGDLHTWNGRNVLCATTYQAGYLYKYNSQRQTERFEINTSSQVGPRNYTLRWSFYENGTIEPAIGLSGILPAVGESTAQYGWPVGANGEIGSSFMDHYLWRLDFDLDDSADNDVVEEINSVPSADRLRKTKTIAAINTERATSLNPETKRFWRVRDGDTRNQAGNYISYELVPSNYDQSRANSRNEAWLQNDVYFTTYNSCERYAANNPTINCGDNVAQFVSGQNLNRQDIVLWYKQNNHYLPRSEDSNRMGMRWSSFKLLPRDWNAQNPF
jgi:primary-amine oxidase